MPTDRQTIVTTVDPVSDLDLSDSLTSSTLDLSYDTSSARIIFFLHLKNAKPSTVDTVDIVEIDIGHFVIVTRSEFQC